MSTAGLVFSILGYLFIGIAISTVVIKSSTTEKEHERGERLAIIFVLAWPLAIFVLASHWLVSWIYDLMSEK